MARIDYAPQGNVLKRFHESDAYVRVIWGPLGSGKTRACLTELLIQILNQTPDSSNVRRSHIAVVRNTQPELMTTVVRDFLEVMNQTRVGDFRSTAPATWTATFTLGDGTTVQAEVLFISFDDPNDQRKARGLQLSGLYLNEAKELSKPNVDLLMSRVGRFPPKSQVPKARHFVIMDSNAADRDHWLAKLTLDHKPMGWRFFVQPGSVLKINGRWEVNPEAENLHNLPDMYYRNQLQAKTESWIRQNLANEFVYHSDGRAVHPDFNEVYHVREGLSVDPTLPLTVGIDFGRTPAAVIAQKQPDGRWFILYELTTENLGALKFGEMLKDYITDHEEINSAKVIEFVGDPAGNQQAQTRDETPFDMLRISGIYAYPAPTNDFEERTTALDILLTKLIGGEPAIVIHPRCKSLIKGLAGEYQFKRVRIVSEERYQDKPNKNMASHVCEALHYLLLGGGERQWFIDQWTKGDLERDIDYPYWAYE